MDQKRIGNRRGLCLLLLLHGKSVDEAMIDEGKIFSRVVTGSVGTQMDINSTAAD